MTELQIHINSILYILYTGILLIFIAIVYFETTEKEVQSIVLITLGVFFIALFSVLSDPFLHMWDEQVHALVAKNMVKHPFKPMFMAHPMLTVNYKNWTATQIWLHKQPLFLWQIAASFKMFGVNYYTLRLPGIFMISILVFPIYKIGKIVSGKRTGIYAAVLYSSSWFVYQLVAGRISNGQNDISFLFYVTLSIWAWFEKENSGKKIWIFLIGLFSGAAILNKWLPGLLVFSVWGLNIIFDKKKREKISSYIELLISFLITVVVALPWQIYILTKFPVESRYEYAYNVSHFSQVIENHNGNLFFYLQKFKVLYGNAFQYIIIISIVIFIFSSIKKKYKLSILGFILIVYSFFSLAATKMVSFTIIVISMIYVISAVGFSTSFKYIKSKFNNKHFNIGLRILVMFSLFILLLNINTLTLKNNSWKIKAYQTKYDNTKVFKQLKYFFKENNTIFFNARPFDNIKIMFYTGDMARNKIPTKYQIKILKKKKAKIAVFDNGKLPNYIINDSTIAKIKSQVWQKNFKNKIQIYY